MNGIEHVETKLARIQCTLTTLGYLNQIPQSSKGVAPTEMILCMRQDDYRNVISAGHMNLRSVL